MKKSISLLCLAALAQLPLPSSAQRLQQPLGRGVVAVYGRSNGSAAVEITWRRLAQESQKAKYNVYVAPKDGSFSLLNAEPLSNTNFSAPLSKVPYGSHVAVSIISDGIESPLSKPFAFNDNGLRNVYMEISFADSPLEMASYTTKFVWPCDLDGDGEYDYVVDRCPVDGSLNYYVEGYLADGTFLWNIDLGVNEKPSDGQNDNMCAYDIDCDGYGELVVQTSDGTRFWDPEGATWGKYLLGLDHADSDGDGIVDYNRQSTKNPPRYMTVVDGLKGTEKASVEFLYDDAYNRTNKDQLMGDEYNKHEAHVGIFYHDGVHPAICGEWTSRDINKNHHFRNCAFAYDYDSDGKAYNWHQLFNQNVGGEVFHQIRIFDADGDGRDEMSSGAYAMDHDGSILYNTGICHGDRHRTTDIDPQRPGLETFSIQQNAPDMLGMILFDARSGQPIKKWYLNAVGDVGRGECIDIDPDHPGLEMFSTMDGYQVFDAKGDIIEGLKGYFPTEGIWWDGQLDRENVNSPDGNGYNAMIVDFKKGRLIEMAKESGWTILSSFGKRGKFWGDIIGDWREELVLIREVGGICKGIVGFTTDFKTDIDNIYCLQQDPHYRADCTTRGYYQSPNTGFYLGYDMPAPPLPPCMVADDVTDVFGIAHGSTEITPRQGVKDLYAMPVKDQTLTLSATTDATVWKGLEGTLLVAGSHNCNFVVSEGSIVLNGEIHGTVDLRARGTLAGSGCLHGIRLEGALNHEGGRLMPQGVLSFDSDLNIDHKTFLEITVPGTDYIDVKGCLDISAPLMLSFPVVPEPGEYLVAKIADFNTDGLQSISTFGLNSVPHEVKYADGLLSVCIYDKRNASENVYWTGAQSTEWDYQSENFILNGRPTPFIEGDGVIFDDSALSTTVNINDIMPVTTVTFSAKEKEYFVTGNGGISGRTILNSGRINMNSLNHNLEIGHATLVVNNANAVCDNPLVVTDSATIVVKSGSTALKAVVSGDGTLIKDGAGQLTLNYFGANSWGQTVLHQGTLAMGTWKSTVGKSNSPIHVTGNSTFVVFNNNSTSEVPTVSNAITIDEGVALTFHAGRRCAIKGALRGKGTYKVDFPYVRGDVYTNASDFEGTYHVTSDNCRFVQPMDFSKATLRLDASSAVYSMKAGSGSAQSLSHKVGNLTGPGTLGNGAWSVAKVTYSDGPTIISGTLNLADPLIDLSELTKTHVSDNAEYQLFDIKGKVNITGTPIVIPSIPKEGWTWDTSTLASDGRIRAVATPDGIPTISVDAVGDTIVFDLLGRVVKYPAPGLYIVNGVKTYIVK